MGTAYPTAVGQPPNPRKKEFLTWIENLLAYRLAETPVNRTFKTYITINIGGSEPIGDGSMNNPYFVGSQSNWENSVWPNIKAAYPTGELTVYLKKGDTWFNGYGNTIKVDRPNTTFSSYGTGVLPILHGTESLSTVGCTGFSNYSGGAYFGILGTEMNSRTFYGLVPDYFSNPYILASTGHVFDRTSSSGAVTSSGQYHFDTTTRRLTIIPLRTSGTLTTSNHYVITHSGVNDVDSQILVPTGIAGVRIDSLAIIGAGGYTSQIWNIMGKPTGTDSFVISNCVALYGGYHNVGALTSDYPGGFTTVYNNTFGLVKDALGSPGVIYNSSGNQEALYAYNNVLGCVIDTNRSAVLERCAHGIYAHTAGTPRKTSLYISYNDNIYAGRGGCCFAPRNGDPFSTANRDSGFITEPRDFVIDLVMDGGHLPTRINAGNSPIIFGTPAGQVRINAFFSNYLAARDTLSSIFEALEYRVTDYDDRGWQFNSIYDIDVGVITGTHNIGLISNSLNAGTEPDRQGVIEDENDYCTFIMNVASGFNNTGSWLSYAWTRNGNFWNDTLNNCPTRKNWRNSLLITNNLGTASLSGNATVFQHYHADPDGPRYISPNGLSPRGGVENCAFWNYRLANTLQSATTGFGINHFLQSGSSINLTSTPATIFNNPTGIPLSSYTFVGQTKSLDPKYSGQYLEYDFYWRTRSVSGAWGAVEIDLPSDVYDTDMINSLRNRYTSRIIGNNIFIVR